MKQLISLQHNFRFRKSVVASLCIICTLTIFTSLMVYTNGYSQDNDSNIILSNYSSNRLDNLFGNMTIWTDGFKATGIAIVNDTEKNFYFVCNVEEDLLGISSNIVVGKLNSTGKLEWIKKWAHNGNNFANDLTIDTTNNLLFVIGESLDNFTSKTANLLLTCIDYTTGSELWNHTIEVNGKSLEGKSIVYYNEKIFFTGIQTNSYQSTVQSNIIIYCANSTTGLVDWNKSYTNNFNDYLPKFELDSSGEHLYLIYNRYDTINDLKVNYYILEKMDLTGSIIWSDTSTSELYPKIYDLVLDPTNHLLLLIGNLYEEANYEFKDAVVICYDNSGVLLHTEIFGKKNIDEVIYAGAFQNNSEFYLGGKSDLGMFGDEVAILAYFNRYDDLNWFRMSEGYAYSDIRSIICYPSGEFYLIGNCDFQNDFLFERVIIANSKDNDHDSLSDFWEPTIGTDPNEYDTDHDGYSDAEEYFASTDPLDPKSFPQRRIFWRNFGVGFSGVVLLSFLVLQSISYVKAADDSLSESKPSLVVRIFNRIIRKLKRKKKTHTKEDT